MLKIVDVFQMDARTLAIEMAPVIMWQKESRPEFYRQYWNQMSKSPSEKSVDTPLDNTAWDMLAGKQNYTKTCKFFKITNSTSNIIYYLTMAKILVIPRGIA